MQLKASRNITMKADVVCFSNDHIELAGESFTSLRATARMHSIQFAQGDLTPFEVVYNTHGHGSDTLQSEHFSPLQSEQAVYQS